MDRPTAFISYSWDDQDRYAWVAHLGIRLRRDGIDVRHDKWAAFACDQLPIFMQGEASSDAFVLIVCTPNYKEQSEARESGIWGRGNVMTAEVFSKLRHHQVIPILARGTWEEAAPSWLALKGYVDLSEPTTFDRAYRALVTRIKTISNAGRDAAKLLQSELHRKKFRDSGKDSER